jgi:SNF family Na+-dependent transporter
MASGKSPQDGGGEQWATRIGVIMAVAGSAVGLGNFLRFPGQAAQNGGGAFMLPYFISLLILGIPMVWAEWVMGRYAGQRGFHSAPGIYATLWKSKYAKYWGSLALMIPLVIYMYYVLIEAWCLGYAWDYLAGNLKPGDNFEAHFKDFTGANADGFIYEGNNNALVWILLGVFALNFVLIYRGISRGIETFCRYAMPLMALCALCVLFRVLTLGAPIEGMPERNVINGLGSMWNPDSTFLWNPQTWLAAAGQIFFSISVGFGIIINYASYVRRNDDIALSGLTAGSVNEFFEVCLGGLITLPAAFIFLGATATTMGTFGLGFNALPNVFAQMAGGRFFGCVWFFMLFLAAITSSISMLQPVIAFFEEGLGLKRHASATMLGLVSALGTGFVLYFSKDSMAMDTLDNWVGTLLIFTLAMFQSVLYGWIFGIERGDDELHKGAHIHVPYFIQYVLKYVAPTYLFIIFATFCWKNLPSSVVPIEPKLEISTAAAADLSQGSIPAAIRAELDAKEIAVPENAAVSPDGAGRWNIGKPGAPPAITVTSGTNADGAEVLIVGTYRIGWIENILINPVAMMAVGLIATILVFLLILINIAGKRWEKEGRLPPAN